MKKEELAKRVADVHALARKSRKVSQEAMEDAIGVSRKTIAKWESGESCPTVLQSFEWFKCLSINPLSRYNWVLSNHDDLKEDEKLNAELKDAIEMLGAEDKKKLLFLLAGNHGSSPSPMLELIMAYLHLPLLDRVIKATVVQESYRISKEMGVLHSANECEPNMEVLSNALNEAQLAVIKHMDSYSLANIDE